MAPAASNGGRPVRRILVLRSNDPVTTQPRELAAIRDPIHKPRPVFRRVANAPAKYIDARRQVNVLKTETKSDPTAAPIDPNSFHGTTFKRPDPFGVFHGTTFKRPDPFGVFQLTADIHRSVAFGQLESMTDFEGRKTQYFYDNSTTGGGRMVEKQYRDHNGTLQRTITYKYDAFGRQTVVGDTGAVKNGTDGSIVNDFDADGRLAAVTSPQGTIKYAYDDRGRMTETRSTRNAGANDDIVTTYGYDGIGRVVAVTSENTNEPVTTYAYDPVGNLKTVTTKATENSVPIVSTYTYDDLNRLDLLEQHRDPQNGLTYEIAKFDYTVRADGKRTSVEETINDETTTIYWAYDAIGRLVGEYRDVQTVDADTVTRYAYDLVGNRIDKTTDTVFDRQTFVLDSFLADGAEYLLNTFAGDEQTTYEYDTQDRLQTETTIGPHQAATTTTTYDYGIDDRGTQVMRVVVTGDEQSTTQYTYNEMGRQSSVTKDGIVQQNRYDAMGNRVYVDDNGTVRQFLIDSNNLTGYAQILEEQDANSTNRTYTIGLDVIAQRDTGATTRLLLPDGHGSTRLLLDTAGGIIQHYDYDAYGNLLNMAASATATSLLYSGEITDPTGQQYLRARYYDPANGRFNRLDPYEGDPGTPQSLHKYLYVHADPIQGIDPSGLQFSISSLGVSISIGAKIGGTIGTAAGGVYGYNKSDGNLATTFQYAVVGGVAGVGVGATVGAFIGYAAGFNPGLSSLGAFHNFSKIGWKLKSVGEVIFRGQLAATKGKVLAAYAIGTASGAGAAYFEPDDGTYGEIAVHGLAAETGLSLTYQRFASRALAQLSSRAAVVASGSLDVTIAFTLGFNTGYFLSKGLELGVDWSVDHVLRLWAD